MQTCPWCGAPTDAAPCTWLPCRIAGRIERALGPAACVLLAAVCLMLAGLFAVHALGWVP